MDKLISIKLSCTLLLSIVSLVSISGCVSTQVPLISHVHIGHTMTGWRDTPGEQGLFITAEQEAKIAYEQASLAVENSNNTSLTKKYIRNVRHALDPKSEPEGVGLDYGFIKALKSSQDHILFATDSDDASENIKSFSQQWYLHTNVILERSELIMAISKEILNSNSREEVKILAEETQLLTRYNLYGNTSDGNSIDSSNYGLQQLRIDMVDMINREDPPYQTVDKKYLFGLIRLPSGEWRFMDFSKSPSNQGINVFNY
jgi:hypothetical protein